MKSNNLLLLLAIVIMPLCSCANKKKMVVPKPCEAETVDDSLYIREAGHGMSPDSLQARENAIIDAQHKIINRFCDSLRLFMPRVEYNPDNDSLLAGFTDTILFRYSTLSFEELSRTTTECEKVTYDSKKQYHCYITMALSESDLDHAGDIVFFDLLLWMSR